MRVRPLQDFLLVEVEKEQSQSDTIIFTTPNPVRFGVVKAVGPGKRYRDRYVPTQVQVGDRIAFFSAAADTQQGKQLRYNLPDNVWMLREPDALFVVPSSSTVKVTV